MSWNLRSNGRKDDPFRSNPLVNGCLVYICFSWEEGGGGGEDGRVWWVEEEGERVWWVKKNDGWK